jgi:hypothetical protein
LGPSIKQVIAAFARDIDQVPDQFPVRFPGVIMGAVTPGQNRKHGDHKKNMSLRRLRRMIFGPKTEASRNLLPKDKDQAVGSNGQSSGSAG